MCARHTHAVFHPTSRRRRVGCLGRQAFPESMGHQVSCPTTLVFAEGGGRDDGSKPELKCAADCLLHRQIGTKCAFSTCNIGIPNYLYIVLLFAHAIHSRPSGVSMPSVLPRSLRTPNRKLDLFFRIDLTYFSVSIRLLKGSLLHFYLYLASMASSSRRPSPIKKGWSSRYLLNSDPGRYSDHTGGGERDRLDSRPPAGCVWADGDTGWELDTTYTRCDAEGW